MKKIDDLDLKDLELFLTKIENHGEMKIAKYLFPFENKKKEKLKNLKNYSFNKLIALKLANKRNKSWLGYTNICADIYCKMSDVEKTIDLQEFLYGDSAG